MEGVPRGEVKYLRILETHSKTVRTTPQRCDIGVNSGWDIRGVLGTVPVEEDGSVYFCVPPYRQLFFEALDKEHLEIRRMRNFLSVMPGETMSCVGCHEPFGTAPMMASGRLMATRRPPSRIEPPPWGTGGFGFKGTVQPILDRKCVQCHDGSKEKDKAFDLRGLKLVSAPVGYDRDHAPHAQHLVSDSFMNLLPHVSYIRVGGYQGEKLPLAPNATGSRQSSLIKMLKRGHNKVALDLSDWRALAAWIDCNAPFYGSWDEIVLPDPSAQPAQVSANLPMPLRSQSARDKARIATRIKELDGEKDSRLLAYIDCGLQIHSDGGSVMIRQIQGSGWTYGGTDVVKDLPSRHRDITFDTKQIVFGVTGLMPGGNYELNLTWWDFNTDQRRQSVWISCRDGNDKKQIRRTTGLPAYLVREEMPERITLPLPPEFIRKKESFRIYIQCDGGANAVLGELWITCSE